MSNDHDPARDDDWSSTPTLEPAKPKLTKPPLYKVLFHNDDFTPMDFVIDVLVKYCNHPVEGAAAIMLDVHEKGIGVAGLYPKDIAETKVAVVTLVAQSKEHPLKVTTEPDK